MWDLNPIRLKANRVVLISFDTIFDEVDAERAPLVEEVRYLLFCILFYVRTGKLGRMTAETVIKYFSVLRTAARYCYDQRAKPLVGVLSLQQLFTNPAYLEAFSQWVIKKDLSETYRRASRAMLNHMVAIGEQRLGYKLHGVFHIGFGVELKGFEQTPIIPTRIYLSLINSSGDWLDELYTNRQALEGFLKAFSDPCFGRSRKQQRSIVGSQKTYKPFFDEALALHNLSDFFTDDLACSIRNHLSVAIIKVQWILKTVIHLYTGMRDQEVLRLPYNCISDEEVVAATVDDTGATRDKPMIVQVLSTTTKYTGYRKAAGWLATDDVVRAVEVARCICRGLSSLYGLPPEEMPLFLAPAIINHHKTEVGVPEFVASNKPGRLKQFLQITEADFHELQVSDPSRDFSLSSKYEIGSYWPFASHQFRRSLAFYGSNSGFISLPTLRSQFKHLTTQMSRYYGNNFEKLKTIFGYYDVKVGDFVLPKNHVLFEYQTGIPMSIAYDLLDHAFGSDSPMFGGVGTYISNQRSKMDRGDIHIADVRKETEKLASEGKISFKPTLLGACTFAGKCKSYLLGSVLSCTSCADGIIEKEKLESVISDNEADLNLYDSDSGEYQVIKAELEGLKKFHQKFISVVEV